MAGKYVEFTFKGTDSLVAKFKELSESARREVATPAAKEAMEIVKIAAIDTAHRIDNPETRKNISKNIIMIERKKVGAETGTVIISVGVRKRASAAGGNSFNWYFVELGTEHARAHPFLRPALWNNRAEVFKEFISSARYQLVKLGVL